MPLGRVQARGQITLPRDVRRASGISPGDTVSIRTVEPGRIELKVVSKLSLKDQLERFPIEGPVDVAADRAEWEAAAGEIRGQGVVALLRLPSG